MILYFDNCLTHGLRLTYWWARYWQNQVELSSKVILML